VSGPESPWAAPRSREEKGSASALLGWQGAPRSLEALAARTGDQAVAATGRRQAAGFPGQPGCRSGLMLESNAGLTARGRPGQRRPRRLR
jgi:hypothetical protein